MNRIATYKFNDLNDTGIDKMPVGAQGVVNKFGDLTRFVKGVEDASLTPSTTIGDYLTNNMGDYYEDVLYPSNNYVQGPPDMIQNVHSHTETSTTNQTEIVLGYSTDYPIAVYLDGIRLDPSDYTANTGTSIILSTPISAGVSIVVLYHTPAYGAEKYTMKSLAAGNSVNITVTPITLNMKSDGTTLIVIHKYGLQQYDLAIPWDITTATLVNSHSISTAIYSAIVNNAGTQIIISYVNNKTVYIYEFNTAWDVSTFNGTYIDSHTFDVHWASPAAGALSFIKRANSTKILIARTYYYYDSGGDVYFTYGFLEMGTADDFTTFNFALSLSSLTAKAYGTSGPFKGEKSTINDTGDYINIITGYSSTDFKEYRLTTPFDITTATDTGVTFAGPNIEGHIDYPGGDTILGCTGSTLTEFNRNS